MPSITTNIRIGAGELISHGLTVTIYIFGFRDGWLSILPNHHPFLVDFITFIILFAIAYKSDFEKYKEMSLKVSTTCFFVMDSGHENIFA